MTKISYRENGTSQNPSFSIWLDDECLVYGLESDKQAQLICQMARLALEKCNIKVLNSFDSQEK